jgi:hypothetical protein
MPTSWEKVFLYALRETGNVAQATVTAGVYRKAVDRRARTSEEFRSLCLLARAEAKRPSSAADRARLDQAIEELDSQPRPVQPIDGGALGPSELQKELEAERDFGNACDLAATAFRREARRIERESSEAPEVSCNPRFWHQCEARAIRARIIWLAVQARARQTVADWYRSEDLLDFAEALESGHFAGIGM